MGAVLLACRLVLAATFVTAGAAKLADLAGSRQAMAEFGVPRRLVRVAGPLLAALELAVAITLVPAGSARLGALAGVILLSGFCVAIALALRRGAAPECHCFGQLRSAPTGPRTLARTGALLALAGFVVVAGWNQSGASATRWVTRLSAPWLVALAAGAAALLQAAWLLRSRRQNRRLHALVRQRAGATPASPDGLEVGARAPEFKLRSADGRLYSLRSLLDTNRRALLVFTDARCAPCDALMPRLARWQRRSDRGLTIAIIAGGDPERNRAKAAEHGLAPMLLQEGGEVAHAYRALGTPMAVLVNGDGHIASPTVASGEAIGSLIAEAAGPLPARAPGVGEPAPKLVLSDLDGRPVELAAQYTERTLVIFWSPRCEVCQRMLLGLQTLERESPAGLPELVVISDGEPGDIRAQDLGSTVLHDPGRRAMEAFGADGTPMAVLVYDGRVASALAAGAVGLVDLLDTALHAHP